MTTRPGVLFHYPPAFHQPSHIAYNIRTPEEVELLAFQQHVMNMSSPLIWSPSTTYPHFLPYSVYEQLPYIYNNSSTINLNSSLLNPEAAEWIPTCTYTDVSASDDNILIDDEINFPPLNSNRIEENNSEQQTQTDSLSKIEPINNSDGDDISAVSKIDSKMTNLSSSQDENKCSSSSKLTTVTYSNVILHTPDEIKVNTNLNSNNQSQRCQQHLSNHINTQLSQRNRAVKQQRTQISSSKVISFGHRHPPSNQNNPNEIRNLLSMETSKQQQRITDDWIEVKSRRTKKFDRSINDTQHENSSALSQKSVLDERTSETLSTPSSSLSPTSDNAIGTVTSEDDDDKDDFNNRYNNKLVAIVENTTISTTATDYNQHIVDDVHRRLENDERLLIILRGCPGMFISPSILSYTERIKSTKKAMKINSFNFDQTELVRS